MTILNTLSTHVLRVFVFLIGFVIYQAITDANCHFVIQ